MRTDGPLRSMPFGSTVHSGSERESLPGIGRATSVFRLPPRVYTSRVCPSAPSTSPHYLAINVTSIIHIHAKDEVFSCGHRFKFLSILVPLSRKNTRRFSEAWHQTAGMPSGENARGDSCCRQLLPTDPLFTFSIDWQLEVQTQHVVQWQRCFLP